MVTPGDDVWERACRTGAGGARHAAEDVTPTGVGDVACGWDDYAVSEGSRPPSVRSVSRMWRIRATNGVWRPEQVGL